jgi:hypothetical protein
MRLRLAAVAVIALLFALTQSFGSAASLFGHGNALAASTSPRRSSSTVMADNDNGASASTDNDNNGANADNQDNDNGASASTDNDNTGAGADNDNDDNGGSSASSAPSLDDASLKQPLTTASGTANGSDLLIAMPGERVAVRIFPSMPAGVQVTVRPIDVNSVPAGPGSKAGDLTFAVEARDANGTQLTSLPAEANLAIRYADDTVSGLNEGNLTLSWLNPTSNTWQAAPKLVREADSNYLAASITQLGTYTVSAP